MVHSLNSHTAFLYFSRTPENEACHKTFLPHGNGSSETIGNQTVAKYLYNHTYNKLAATGYPVFAIPEDEQKGESFGDKLADAFSRVFAAGYNKVIAVGNDTPGLTTNHLIRAADSLTEHPVIGPNSDGGVYLIGLDYQAFCRFPFHAVSWHTGKVFSEIKAFFPASVIFSVLTDVDGPDSLYQVANLLPGYIKTLLHCTGSHPVAPGMAPVAAQLNGNTFSLRGPPAI